MAISENPTRQQLKDLAAQYPDLEITRMDSLEAGNCLEGTDEFIEEYFRGCDSVKVSQLVEYIDTFTGVCTVLEYKFRQLEKLDDEKQPEAKQDEEHPF